MCSYDVAPDTACAIKREQAQDLAHDEVMWTPTHWQKCSCVHLFETAIDHGIIKWSQLGTSGKKDEKN